MNIDIYIFKNFIPLLYKSIKISKIIKIDIVLILIKIKQSLFAYNTNCQNDFTDVTDKRYTHSSSKHSISSYKPLIVSILKTTFKIYYTTN